MDSLYNSKTTKSLRSWNKFLRGTLDNNILLNSGNHDKFPVDNMVLLLGIEWEKMKGCELVSEWESRLAGKKEKKMESRMEKKWEK